MARIRLVSVDLHYAVLGLRDRSLKSMLLNIGCRPTSAVGPSRIHALKNLTVEIGPGERVGLLGHNGAGKSTFLKAVAGLYPLSQGELSVVGDVRALFDLSLGFEPDATGRENILYRGLLMGLTPATMRAIEPEVVNFAGIGDFIDYPVKTYSAGMLVRLAFAISTSVGGDILLIDEVIGAGDTAFMQKAKARIMRLIERSEILVLASHDTVSLQSLCTRGLVLHHGELVHDGAIAASVRAYERINGLA